MPKSNKFNTTSKAPVVLLSPLDWGLGHTTRCIPIIHELIQQECAVIIACNSTQKALLIQEFPQLTYVPLQGYNLQYGKSRWSTLLRIFFQVPKILIKINNEHTWLNIFLKSHPVDLIISDNRFGFYARNIPSIFITHQLAIKTGLGKLADRLVQQMNYRRIQQFSRCWVPDFLHGRTLAGELSHAAKLPTIPVEYIGGISRFAHCKTPALTHSVLVILSGPEPQRSIFERLVLHETGALQAPIVLVRGLPATGNAVQQQGNVTIYDHAAAEQLNDLICKASLVISRSGYTTVMDLLKLRKKSILVPTPGQAEQEYLAAHLYNQQLAYTIAQHRFSLPDAIAAAQTFTYASPTLNMDAYKNVIRDTVAKLKNA